MAKQVTTTLVDDIDGDTAVETVTFGYNGKTLELDLNEANAKAFHGDLDGWAEHARVIKGGKKAVRISGAGRREDGNVIRDWARQNGHQVGDRGRIPAEVIEAYDAAH